MPSVTNAPHTKTLSPETSRAHTTTHDDLAAVDGDQFEPESLTGVDDRYDNIACTD